MSVTWLTCRVDPAGDGPVVGFGAKSQADRWRAIGFCIGSASPWSLFGRPALGSMGKARLPVSASGGAVWDVSGFAQELNSRA